MTRSLANFLSLVDPSINYSATYLPSGRTVQDVIDEFAAKGALRDSTRIAIYRQIIARTELNGFHGRAFARTVLNNLRVYDECIPLAYRQLLEQKVCAFIGKAFNTFRKKSVYFDVIGTPGQGQPTVRWKQWVLDTWNDDSWNGDTSPPKHIEVHRNGNTSSSASSSMQKPRSKRQPIVGELIPDSKLQRANHRQLLALGHKIVRLLQEREAESWAAAGRASYAIATENGKKQFYLCDECYGTSDEEEEDADDDEVLRKYYYGYEEDPDTEEEMEEVKLNKTEMDEDIGEVDAGDAQKATNIVVEDESDADDDDVLYF